MLRPERNSGSRPEAGGYLSSYHRKTLVMTFFPSDSYAAPVATAESSVRHVLMAVLALGLCAPSLAGGYLKGKIIMEKD